MVTRLALRKRCKAGINAPHHSVGSADPRVGAGQGLPTLSALTAGLPEKLSGPAPGRINWTSHRRWHSVINNFER